MTSPKEQTQSLRPKRAPKPRPQNPIEVALTPWLTPTLAPSSHEFQDLLAQAPKRWTIYEPMVLLPSGAFTSPRWAYVLTSVGDERTSALWAGILAEISKRSRAALACLAVNEGIPPRRHDEAAGTAEAATENVLRSPSGLRMLHGDFGPAELLSGGGGGGGVPGEADFARALWVSTTQNGIRQTWAPRWTMFSRGNIKEKARLLDFHRPRTTTSTSGDPKALQHRGNVSLSTRLQGRGGGGGGGGGGGNALWAVDLYAGIGYFVFSYARLGLRVLCWELNPWSVEGLRRGAAMNGWTVRVVQGGESMGEILEGGERIVVFLEDNKRAAERIGELREREREKEKEKRGPEGCEGWAMDILHVNCGLLPRSDASWRDAWDIVGESPEAWLHLHENVGVDDIEKRRSEIERWFMGLPQEGNRRRIAHVEHVELVKTFAPGVWHCVFDVYITRSSSIT